MLSRPRTHPGRVALVLTLALGLGAAACSSSGNDSGTSTTTAAPTTSRPAGTSTTVGTVPGGGIPTTAPDPQAQAANEAVVAKLDSCSQQAGGCRGVKLDFASPGSGTDLSHRDFSGASLSGADFSGVVLQGADFRNAKLGGALFIGADLTGADLTGADLEGAMFVSATVTQDQLAKARLCNTTAPDGTSVGSQC